MSLENKDIFYSQVRSILESECIDRLKVMFPMVSTIEDFLDAKNYVNEIAEELDLKTPPLGIMVETPSSALMSDQFAEVVDFISIGTNDLTQTTFGISRDDSGKFLNDYIDNKIFSIDPFISIDEGVEDLIQIAVEKGKKQNKKIKLGICGEHGGDPKSIHFCSKAGLNYVSCSPYRVPIARLAAAQAELKKIDKK